MFIHSTKILIVIIYVDDILVILDSTKTITWLYQNLQPIITIKSLGPIGTFLGIEVTRNRDSRSITLGQQAYTKRLLEKFGYPLAKETRPLVPIGNQIRPNEDNASPDTTRKYQQEIGSIMYLMTKTRPDLAYPIGLCARFMANPGPEHFKALAKIWKYLGHTWNLSLTYQSDTPITTYCDADWGVT